VPMTRSECAKLLAYAAAAVPQARVPAQTAEVWWDLLGDLPYAVAVQALRRVLAEQRGTWWPAIGDIRAAAQELLDPGRPSVEQAWGQVQAAVRQYGYYQPDAALAHLDLPVRAVAEALGWEAICLGDPDVLRGQFARYYTAHTTQADRARRLPVDLRDGALAAGSRAADPGPPALADVLRRALDREAPA
jgi:hypothetical protein